MIYVQSKCILGEKRNSMKILLKNGRIYDPRSGENRKADIAICNGIIHSIGKAIYDADEILDCCDKWIVPSVTDMHVHCFHKRTNLGLYADEIGICKNVRNLVDAGSCGADDIDDFMDDLSEMKTRVKIFINYSSIGLTKNSCELSENCWLDEDKLMKAIKKYPDVICGVKLRASKSVVKDKGTEPIRSGIQFAHRLHLPLMIHVGNEPPKLDEVLSLVEKGDILTHIYHGKKGGLFLENGELNKLAIKKYQKGVLFDVGHGSASFSFDVAEKAFKLGLIPHLISSDLHANNYPDKISSLAEIVTKIYNLGLNERQILDAISIRPAKILHLDNMIQVGNKADLSIVSFNKTDKKRYVDAEGNERIFDKKVVFERLVGSEK